MEINVPKLRFKEFNDEWKISKVGEITSKVGSGKTPKGGNSVYVSDGIMFIRSQNVLNGKLSLDDVVYISEEENDRMKSTQIKANDVLINITGASIGRCCKVPADFKNGNLNQHVCIIRPNKDNSEFIMNYMISDKIQKQIFSFQAGGNREGLNFEQIKGMTIGMPSIQEQERIANFLTKVDRIIEKQDEKVKNLEKYKKGMMQKIFSQEIRFKDENGEAYPEWEIKRVEDVANIQVGFTPDTKNDSFWDGDIKWLSIAGMNSKYIFDGNKRISNEALGKRELIPKNTLVMSFKLTIGRLAIIKEPMITNEAICQFYWKNKNIINEYMYQYLDSIRIESFGCRAAKGITLNNESLNSIIVKLPCLDEQNKIADLLNNIDCIHQEELNKLNELKQWKKGLLQQMFV